MVSTTRSTKSDFFIRFPPVYPPRDPPTWRGAGGLMVFTDPTLWVGLLGATAYVQPHPRLYQTGYLLRLRVLEALDERFAFDVLLAVPLDFVRLAPVVLRFLRLSRDSFLTRSAAPDLISFPILMTCGCLSEDHS